MIKTPKVDTWLNRHKHPNVLHVLWSHTSEWGTAVEDERPYYSDKNGPQCSWRPHSGGIGVTKEWLINHGYERINNENT